ncbi:unnamed protein product [Rhodiola kirilowii]
MEQNSTDSVTPKSGFASVCGQRRDMEDAVHNKLSFLENLRADGQGSD